ncbi:hypothetical protein GQ607_017103 [Colletotrichum asianum]|uniref:Uncharacterized protein n=1 Tax=Colletotrichum asianum TaxID=702518 RepID=A0A8H3VY67_9PEZI|nr:hypothetical protein GQ607_017103 [Colletotrichum asianum]
MADDGPPPPPNFIDTFPYRRTPTTANVRHYVQSTVVPAHDAQPADASRASALLLTNLQAEHRLLGSELRDAGVMRPADALAARNLRGLIELWPNGIWVPYNLIPPGTLPGSLLKEMLAFSRTVAARYGQAWLPHLWDTAPRAHPAGVLRQQMAGNAFLTRQVIRAARASFFDAPPPPPLPPAPPFAAPLPFAQELAGRLDQRRQVLDAAAAGPPRPPPLPPAPAPAAPVPFARELAGRLNQRRQALDRAPPRPPPLPPAPIPAGPLPFAAQPAARLEEIRRRRQQDDEFRGILQAALDDEIERLGRLGLDDDFAEDEDILANINNRLAGERVEGDIPPFDFDEDEVLQGIFREQAEAWRPEQQQRERSIIPEADSSDVDEPEQELRGGNPLSDMDEPGVLDWGNDPPPAQSPSPDYNPPPIPPPDDDDFRFSSPSPPPRNPPNNDDRDHPDELGLSGSDLEDVAAPLPRRRARPQPYVSVEAAVDQVSRGAASSTSRRLGRAANFFTPAQRAAVTREAERATRAMLERFAAENAAAAAVIDISDDSSTESERQIESESEDELAG